MTATGDIDHRTALAARRATVIDGGTEAASKDQLAAALDVARSRSLALLAPLDDAALTVQHSPLMSPLVWDLAHIGNYEDLWLVRAIGGSGVGPHLDDMYDAFRHPRPNRPRLPLLGPAEARSYLREVRKAALEHLDRVEVDPAQDDRLLRSGFVYGMVVQHEHQHDETMLATLQLMAAPGYRPDAVSAPRRAPGDRTADDEVVVPGGTYVVGTTDEPWAYDNEGPAHAVELAPFAIDTAPVTNAAFKDFIEDGGYDEPRLWSAEGWAWREEAGLAHPEFWERDGEAWLHDRFGIVEAVSDDEPVQHVCWFEADAFARWSGKRLPTEQEWEVAASTDPATGARQRLPWGDDAPPSPEHANVGQRHFGPASAGAFPAGTSPVGCQQMVGDVWEWTSSDFAPYPGFASFPYREYSEVFFGSGYKVLRGGSWATHPSMARTTFRNWDWPIRRQIFAGFRCARDA